ncbi:MAG: acylneuraminate cytidylyltransferase family protein [Eubacterium sp.]|nr:acylneuraminate cytidylyltransferase family protein [Eubacterium sp.]
MNYLFTLCARAGSKGFKNKNLKEFCSKPVSFYSLAAVKLFADRHKDDNVTLALNTDSEELKQLFKAQSFFGDIVFVDRKAEHADDKTAKVIVIQDTYNECRRSCDYDLIIDLDITSPMRTVTDIENAVKAFESGENDLAFSVCNSRRNPYFNMVEKDSEGVCRRICKASFTTRQQAPKTYDLNASIYVYSPKFLSSEIEKTILDYKFDVSIMEDYLVLDIDSEEDYNMMQHLYPFFCKSNPELNEIADTVRQIEY